MKTKYKVGNLEIGADLPNDTSPWFSVYVKNRKEMLRLPLIGAGKTKAKAVAALLAGMIRENKETP